jgi:hypothetical protein
VTFSEGWVCRSCWKSNRPKDDRCYRCRTPRDADTATVEANRVQRERESERRERVPVVVGEIPARILNWYGRGGIVAAFLAAVALVLAIGQGDDRARDVPIIGLVAVACLVYGVTLRWAAGEMRAARFWGFAVALVVCVAALAFYLTILAYVPPEIADQSILRYVGLIILGIAGVSALIGLVVLGQQPRGAPDN